MPGVSSTDIRECRLTFKHIQCMTHFGYTYYRVKKPLLNNLMNTSFEYE